VVRHGRADRELRKNGDAALGDRLTKSQIHLVAWALVMVVQIAHGHIAERSVSRGPNDPPPRKEYPWLVHMLVAGVIAAAIGYVADVFGWVQD
jgi:hypothetical protein